jgi:hypothetical protein
MEDPGPVIGAAEDAPPPAQDVASVVTVDPNEDVASICGRVDGASTWAVVLHAARGNRQLSTELGMRRLLHHCEDSGKVIAIATGSGSLASRARELRVPVARRPQHIRWDSGGRHVVRVGRLNIAAPSIGRWVQVGIIAAVAFGGLYLLLAMAPSATVVAYPPTETVSEVVSVTASESRTQADFAGLQLPASRVSTEQKFTLAARTTGTAQVGTAPAKVAVTITNSTSAAVVVVDHTIVLAGPDFFQFATDETVTIPANGSAPITATALTPGIAGNVPAGAVAGWQAEKFRFLKITNPAAAAGGVSEPRPAVDPRDVLTLNDLARALQSSETVRQVLLDSRPRDAVFLGTTESTLTLSDPKPAVGSPGELVLMEVTVKLSALALDERTLAGLANYVLEARGGGQFVPGTFRARETGARQVDAETGLVKADIQVQGELARGVTSEQVREAVKGKSKEDALSTLSRRYGIQDADVRLSGWAPRLPRFSFRIEASLAAREPTVSANPPPPHAAAASTAAAPTATPRP